MRIRTAPWVCRRNPKGSREPVAPFAGARQRHERIELVGERNRSPRHRGGAQLVARGGRIRFDADRQVLVVDGFPDLLRQPFVPCVDPAHRTLQLGELEHHLGR
jgi:hypothetical protein